MHIVFAAPILILTALPGSGQPAVPNTTTPSAERNEARWADWEAQARIVDGDYEGALQAEQHADTERRSAATREARSPER